MSPARPASAQDADAPLYQDSTAAVADRVEDLLGRMTLDEKIGQMTQVNYQFINNPAGDWSNPNVEVDEARLRDVLEQCPVGSFLNGTAVPAEQWLTFGRNLQRITMEESRLGIPMIFGVDHVHGTNYLGGGTLFPQGFNLGATFDPSHAEAMARVTVQEAAALGHHWNFAPILDVARTAHWPRVYETFGEDPYVASVMGAAYVEALQAERIGPYRMAATAKHFLGYGHPRSGWDRTPAAIPDQELYEFHVPPFKAAIDAGVMTAMINSGEINGVPVHASARLVTDLLRDELGFEGVAVTDWEDIKKLVNFHFVAEDEKEATRLAIEAGLDMSMVPMSLSFCDHMRALVEEGALTEERLDESVRRILKLKFDLGLFEHPMPSDAYLSEVGAGDHTTLALEAARASIVLLKNDGTLPLRDVSSVLLVGPSADSKRNLSGGWSLRWQGAPEEEYPDDMRTIYTALQEALGEASVVLADSSTFETQAAEADVVVLALGEEPYTENVGNRVDLSLPAEQVELARAAAASGTPVVVVYVGGRPRAMNEVVDLASAVVFAGLPGFEGARAIADVLDGAVNPSGKLSVSIPFGPSHAVPYNYKPTQALASGVVNLDEQPHRFSFGYGLSYTTFSYRDLTLSADTLSPGETLTATVTVENTGSEAGQEAVLWFVTDDVGRVTRPIRMLKHFEKVTLEAGQSETLTFSIDPQEHLTYPDATGAPVLEDGAFTLRVGDQEATFRVTP